MLGRGQRACQRVLPFLERKLGLERTFKLTLAALSCGAVALALVATAAGRYLAGVTISKTRAIARATAGLPPDRAAIDADWARRRGFDMASAQSKHAKSFGEYSPSQQRLLDYAGLEPERALVRWGNFNKTVLLPGTVFEADNTGRSYRMRPGVRSIWVRDFPMKGVMKAFFQVVDTPRAFELARDARVEIVAGSAQTTNSWGLRGPEPNLNAGLKGIVLGDSYMQGLFVDDEHTPSELLKRDLARRTRNTVEILNTGCLGYSPEQYYYTLIQFAERFPPRFVVVSVFANDVGDLFDALEGQGDWDETAYWLDRIRQYCASRRIFHLVVPAPWVNQVEGALKSGNYPGKLADRLSSIGPEYLDPMPAFANARLAQVIEDRRKGQATAGNPFFNGRIGDGHFSALGCALWAQAVGERLKLLMDLREAQAAAERLRTRANP